MRPTSSPTDAALARIGAVADARDDSRSSSSTNSPAPADHEESDFFLGANDSQSSLGVPGFQDMQVTDSNESCWPPIDRLPNEILIHVFAKLPSSSDTYHCMLVCKRWARNVVDLLWHRPACTNWKNLESICQTLALDEPFFTYKDFIKRLNLAVLSDKISDGSVMPLSVCTRVERLTLTNCRGLTDQGLVALVENSTSLLALDISNDHLVTDESIFKISEHCHRLQGLNISGCELINNESMVALAENCKYIKRLKLNDCAQLTDKAIQAFADHCPNILEIDLHQCIAIGNTPITSLLANGNCLRELRLAGCELIDDNAFLSLPGGQTYEHLRILDLSSCHRLSDAAVAKIIESAPRLRNLVLAKCRNITDVAVTSIAKLGKNLHYVHLGHCVNITDEGVKRLVSSCNRIRYIDLGCCANLTDDSVKRLAILPKLKRIGLVKCSSITDDSVVALADAAFRPRVRRDANGVFAGEYYASSLERVHLSYCVNLTLRSIMRLLNSCPRLTHLSLTGVAAFQRDDFQPFCRAAPPEFTQHQRDVFCVFSGNMVSQFRDFLNYSPQFEELRGPRRIMNPGRERSSSARQANDLAHAMNSADREGFDDENPDEDNDFEGLDGSDLALEGQATPVWPPIGSTGPNTHPPGVQSRLPFMIPIPPPAPSQTSSNPFGPNQSHLLPASPMDMTPEPSGPLAFSSFLNNEPANGVPPLSAHGQSMMASYASQGPDSAHASAANAGWAGNASTAPMYQTDDQVMQTDQLQSSYHQPAQPTSAQPSAPDPSRTFPNGSADQPAGGSN